jgi:radical SAM enzyme (TIGR01210 family)
MARTTSHLGDREVLAARTPKNAVDPWKPHVFFVEPERTSAGVIEDVATILLTNRECPFRCVFCDLWRNTTDERVPTGAIPRQIEYALTRLPPARHLKLYNAGSFFDAQAVPPEDHRAIAALVGGFETLIVENHPRFCGRSCVLFRDLLGTKLEVALGLEIADDAMLRRLNKRMTLEDFAQATEFLRRHDISIRSFVLLRPPWLTDEEGAAWAIRSLAYAFLLGAGCCCVIPTRAGNGIMDALAGSAEFAPPSMAALERVHAAGITMNRGRVFADLWDIARLFRCSHCGPLRAARLQEMNLTQQILPVVGCETCASGPALQSPMVGGVQADGGRS